MPNRIRVVELVYSFSVEGPGGGGVTRFGVELSRALDPTRFEVRICGLWDLGTAFERARIEQLNSEGIEAFAASEWSTTRPYRSFWKAFRTIKSALRQQPADILHSHSVYSDMMAIWLRMGFRRPLLVRTVHGGYEHIWRAKPVRRLVLMSLLYPLLFDAEIGISRDTVSLLNCRWISKVLRRPAQHIANAIDLDRFAKPGIGVHEKKRSLQLPVDAPLIGTVGRLNEQKGYSFLIEAAALVLERLPQAYFLIVGDGELRGSLMEQARRLGIDSRVVFTGPRSDVEELLACMDLFVSPSLWEGLPTVIIESMASGVPVVATDIAGTRELLQDGVTGWLVPPADSRALADAILAAMASAANRADVARRGREVIAEYSINAVARRYEALFEDLHGCKSTLNSPTSST